MAPTGPSDRGARAPQYECVICGILESHNPAWYDSALVETAAFSVIPGLGAQTEGYLLIVPRVHVRAYRELPVEMLVEAATLVDQIRSRLRRQYGPLVAFEHGSCGQVARAGGCIDHAHLHLVPTRARIDVLAKRDRSFDDIEGIGSLGELPRRPYLALQTQDEQLCVSYGDDAPGQYFRRLVAEAIGDPFRWDYSAFPQLDKVRATVEHVGPILSDVGG